MPSSTDSTAAGKRGLGGALAIRIAVPTPRGWSKVLGWLRASNTGLLALALVIGAGAGVGAIVFRWLIRTFTIALSGHHDYSAAGHAANPTKLIDAADLVSRSRHGQLAVLDGAGAYLGVLTARAAADALADGEHDETEIGTLSELPTAVDRDDLLDSALDALEATRGAIPVLDADHANVVGWLTHQRVLAAQRRPVTQ